MPPTPVTADGVLRLTYEVTSLEHHSDFFVDVTDMGGGSYEVTRNPPLTGTDPAADVGQAIWTLLRPFWPNSVAAASYTLFRRDENILIPVTGGSLSGAGSSAGTIKPASGLSMTFRDANQFLMRLYFAETVYQPPSKDALGNVDASIDAFTDSVLATPDGTELSTWIRVRTGDRPQRGLFVSVDTNDKYRRARGL